MGNPVPTQTRTVDPYSSYLSDNVNKINRIITTGDDCLIFPELSIVEIINPNTIKVNAGNFVKDDVLIEIEDIVIDMNDPDYYVTGSAWSTTGTYYVILNYNYSLTNPAPQAKIQIIKPSGRAAYDADPSQYIFINALTVISSGGLQVSAVLNSDPTYPNTAKRVIRGSGIAIANVVVYTTNTIATGDEGTILAFNNINITLPLASVSEKLLTIINGDSNPKNIQCSGTDTIENLTSIVMNNIHSSVTLEPYSTLWYEV